MTQDQINLCLGVERALTVKVNIINENIFACVNHSKPGSHESHFSDGLSLSLTSVLCCHNSQG